VEIPLKAETLAWWDEKLPGWKVESEPMKVMIGDSSADMLLNATIHVE
jgi:beta-glucosidase